MIWSYILKPFQLRQRNQNLHLYALLCSKFNSQIPETRTFRNLLNQKTYSVFFKKPYVPTSEKYGNLERTVGEWPLNRLSGQLHVNVIGKADMPSFYYPLDLLELEPEIKLILGKPRHVHTAYLLSSGRSLMVIPEKSEAFTLKIGTSAYSGLKAYSMRLLNENNIHFCSLISDYCGRFHPLFPEKSGASVSSEVSVDQTHQLSLTAMIRKPTLPSVRANDYLVPITAFFSERFWSQKDLLQDLGINLKSRSDMFDKLAQLLAVQIETSFQKSFMHFQAHQQNLTLLIRHGQIVELINHDLTDTLYDPVTHLLHTLCANTSSSNRLQKDQLSSLYEFQYTLARFYNINLHGQLIVPESNQSGFSVLSYYLRFLHNLGEFSVYHQFFTGRDDFYQQLCHHLKIGDDSQKTTGSAFFFRQLDCLHREIQNTYLNNLARAVFAGDFKKMNSADVARLIQTSRTVSSYGFPPHIRDLQPESISQARDLYSGRVIFCFYDEKPCLLICFQGIQ